MKKLKFILLAVFLLVFNIAKSQIYLHVNPAVGTDYTSITQAIDTLSNYTNQDVIIKIASGIYNEQLDLSSTQVLSLTFMPEDGSTQPVVINAPKITDVIFNYTVKVNNSNNIKFDNITIQNKNANMGHVVVIAGNSANSFQLSNCVLIGADTNLAVQENALFYDTCKVNSDFLISNTQFLNGSYSAYFEKNYADSVKFEGCKFLNFYYTGIYSKMFSKFYVEKCQFLGNEKSYTKIAINIDSTTSPLVINSNTIRLTGGFNTAIKINNQNSNLQLTESFITNNMISINGNQISNALDFIDNDSVLSYSSIIHFYFNNILINNENGGGSVVKLANYYGSSDTLNSFNNIMSVGQNVYCYQFESGFYKKMDFNVYYMKNSTAFVDDNGTVHDLNSYQTSGYETASLTGNPLYYSDIDLHINNYFLTKQKGIQVLDDYLNLCLYDIDGQTRINPPDIGADQKNITTPTTVTKITSNTTWNGTVNLTTNIEVEPGVILYIDSATQVILDSNVYIHLLGNATIQANGSKFHPITFAPALGDQIWGGIQIDSSITKGSSTSNFNYCIFSRVNSTGNGGAISLNSNNANFNHCKFTDNVSNGYGGAIYSLNARLSINACEFYNNSSLGGQGGAIYATNSGIPINYIELDNSIFKNNYAYTVADIFVYAEIIKAANNVFWGSTADFGITSFSSQWNNITSTPVYLENNIFWNFNIFDNIVDSRGDSIEYITNDIQYNAYTAGTGGKGFESNYDFDPLFVNPAINDFHLQRNSPCIDRGSDLYIFPIDKDGRPRPFNSTLPDLGVYEVQGSPIFAFAGNDTSICSENYKLNANYPGEFTGTWSIASGSGIFVDNHLNTSGITKLGMGANYLVWSVTDGLDTVRDTVLITNDKPIADAGQDISLISVYPNLIDSVQLKANELIYPYFGMWSMVGGTSVIVNSTLTNTFVRFLVHGENVFRWTVTDTYLPGCSSFDDVVINVGFGFVNNPAKSSTDWNDNNTWLSGGFTPLVAPTIGDSVAVNGNIVNVTGISNCSSLSIGTAGNIVINGITKGSGNLNAGKIYIQQNAEKAPSINDTARLTINNGTLNILTSSGESDGLIVGSNGLLTIQPLDASSTAELHIGTGVNILVKPSTLAKTATGDGTIKVVNGGKIYIEQNAEKTAGNNGGNVVVGTGGKIYIEQNAEKTNGKTEVVVGSGGKIYIEQNAEKSSASNGGQLVVNGGKIYIQQNAEKTAGSNNTSSINVGSGGKIYIEQNAENALDSSILIFPSMYLSQGSQLIIGSGVKKKGNTATVNGGKIYIEQNAEKGAVLDTAIIINPSGNLTVSSNIYMQGRIYQQSNTAVTINQGGALILLDSSKYVLSQNASLIDYNEIPNMNGAIIREFDSLSTTMFSSPFNNLTQDQLEGQFSTNLWNPATSDYEQLSVSDMLNSGSGYKVSNLLDRPINKQLNGTFNTGNVEVALNSANEGINLTGNPYPSSINWDSLTKDANIQKAFYVYDATNNNYKIYQSDGLSLLGGSPIIGVTEGFYVVTKSSTSLTFVNASRLHYNPIAVKDAKTVSNSLIFNVTNGTKTDELGFVFKGVLSNQYNQSEDALKLSPLKSGYITFSSQSSDLKNLAIDGRPIPDSNTSLPIYFISDMPGTYNISLSQENMTGVQKILLKDDAANVTTDFMTTSLYTFNYPIANVSRKFELKLSGSFTNINEPDNVGINIYSYDNIVYISSQSSNIDEVQIINLLGSRVFSSKIGTTQAILKPSLASGLYIVRVNVDGKIYYKKIVL